MNILSFTICLKFIACNPYGLELLIADFNACVLLTLTPEWLEVE